MNISFANMKNDDPNIYIVEINQISHKIQAEKHPVHNEMSVMLVSFVSDIFNKAHPHVVL